MYIVPVRVRVCYGYGYRHCIRLKSKQNGGIRSARRFRTSVGSEIDVDCTEETAILIEYYGYGYERTTGMGTDVRAGIDANLFFEFTVVCNQSHIQ